MPAVIAFEAGLRQVSACGDKFSSTFVILAETAETARFTFALYRDGRFALALHAGSPSSRAPPSETYSRLSSSSPTFIFTLDFTLANANRKDRVNTVSRR